MNGNILQKWQPVLANENAPKIKTKKIENATAMMLENQEQWLQKNGGLPSMSEAINDPGTAQYSGSLTPNGNAYADSGFFNKMAIPMVRRTFPNLIAHEIVGVQPMSSPVGLAFAMRFVADGTYSGAAATQEIGYNTIDSSYTGSYATSAGEALGSNSANNTGLGFGTNAEIPEISVTWEKDQVEAKTRKLRARWSQEIAQDIQNMHGLNLEEEMMDALAYEVVAEVDRELIGTIRSIAPNTNVDMVSDFDGRWESEKNRNLFNLLIRKANLIATKTRIAPANYVVANPNVCAALETMPSFAIHPIMGDINTASQGVAKLGALENRLTLYRDTFQATDTALLGFKGANEYQTGVVYMPYIPLQMARATDYSSFQPSLGLLTRYAIHSHLFGADTFYENVTVTSMP